jgi:uncharacterized protein YuzE
MACGSRRLEDDSRKGRNGLCEQERAFEVNLRIGRITFDDVDYDAEGDVLYLSVGKPRPATESDETPEGHVVRYGPGGEIIGLTLINPRWLINNEGAVTVTLSRAERIEASDIASVLSRA